MNVTYFTGTGASAGAIPIWNEQSTSMIRSEYFLEKHTGDIPLIPFLDSKDPNENPFKNSNPIAEILWEMRWLGFKAREFGTIDTYAKKLYLNDYNDGLQRLKAAIATYFTLWEFSKDYKMGPYASIDNRYVNLFSKILEKGKNKIEIPHRYSFITWNYDLQLERTFRMFLPDERPIALSQLNKEYLKFHNYAESTKQSNQVVHLNGFHGGYFSIKGDDTNKQQFHLYLDRLFDSPKKTINTNEILELFDYFIRHQWQKRLSFENTISYAWERNEQSNERISIAKEIIAKTDVLVIIGYSFPVFNRTIDRELLNMNDLRLKKIIVQDPFLDLDFFKTEFNVPKEIEVRKQDHSQFYVV